MKKVLLGSVVAIALLTGCSDEKKPSTEAVKEVKQETAVVTETNKDTTPAVVESAIKETVIQSAPEVAQKTNEAVKESVEASAQLAKDVTKPIVEKTIQKADEIKETSNVVKEEASSTESKEVPTSVVESSIDAKALFKACASCHGEKAEKIALGKSQVIAGWDKQRIINAINGYKDGSYGGVMKNIMKGQVSTKTDAEIDALAGFISNL